MISKELQRLSKDSREVLNPVLSYKPEDSALPNPSRYENQSHYESFQSQGKYKWN